MISIRDPLQKVCYSRCVNKAILAFQCLRCGASKKQFRWSQNLAEKKVELGIFDDSVPALSLLLWDAHAVAYSFCENLLW
jgi:hypothetical protein